MENKESIVNFWENFGTHTFSILGYIVFTIVLGLSSAIWESSPKFFFREAGGPTFGGLTTPKVVFRTPEARG